MRPPREGCGPAAQCQAALAGCLLARQTVSNARFARSFSTAAGPLKGNEKILWEFHLCELAVTNFNLVDALVMVMVRFAQESWHMPIHL